MDLELFIVEVGFITLFHIVDLLQMAFAGSLPFYLAKKTRYFVGYWLVVAFIFIFPWIYFWCRMAWDQM